MAAPTALPRARAGARVIVGLSGGVDSAVAALLLKDAGWEVQGLFMSNWEEDDDAYCTAAQDYQDARAVAAELGIPLHRASFARDYRERVFAHFLRELEAGRTPNPDVLCNREIKFGVALAWARRLGAEFFATGHYARCCRPPTAPACSRHAMRAKDQSYFLSAVPRAELARCLMPLGELAQGRRARAGTPRGAAGVRQARQHRHLLHRRAPVPRVPRTLRGTRARHHRIARRRVPRHA